MEKAIRRNELLTSARTGASTVVPVILVRRVNGPSDTGDVVGSGVIKICVTVSGLSPVEA